MFKQFKFKLFLKLFIFYTVSIMLPFIITSLFLSQYVISTYRNNVFSLYDNITEYISSIMDNNLYDIDTAADNLKNSSAVINASTHTNLSGNAVYDLKLLQNELKLHRSYQTSSSGLHVYLESSNIILADYDKFSVEDYYSKFFSSSDKSYIDFTSILKSVQDTVMISSGDDSITIVKPLFTDIHGNNVTLLSTIDTRMVYLNFSQITEKLSTAYFVITDDSRPLIKSPNTPDVVQWEEFLSSNKTGFVECSNKYVALKTKSILPTLNYVYIISESEILAKVNFIQTILSFIILVIFFILIIVAYVMSCRSFSPVSALISNSSEGNSYYKLDSYDDISVLVADTINTNNSLRSTIDRQRKCINDNLFVMFLQNSMNMSTQSLDMLFADVKPELNQPFYNVILVNIQNYSDLSTDIAKLSTVETMRRILNENEILFTLIPNDAGRLIVLANHNVSNETLKAILKKLVAEIKNNLRIEIFLNIGRQFETLNIFSKSYEDAMYSSTINKPNLSPIDVSEKDIKSIFFNADDKRNLKNYVFSLDGASVNSFFENLTSKIFVENILTYRVLSYIRYSLSETLSEIIYNSTPNDEFEKILNDCRMALEGHDYMDSFKTISDCYLKVTDQFAKMKNAPQEDLKNALMNYIEKNYSNPEISLKQIAKELHFSYSYLCKFFKKEMGCVFLDYLHSLRIEQAKKLLRDEKKSIAEIGESLGYLSSNTFIKTFKKYEGISPGEYRKNPN